MNKSSIVILALLFSACTLSPQLSEPVAIYDFGLQQTNANPIAKQSSTKTPSLLLTEVASSIWLDNHAIHYRLAYHNATQRYSYANSRWAATPAALLTRQIGNRLMMDTDYKIVSANDGVHAEYALHSVLEDFSQVFYSADESHAIIHLHISLIERRTRSLRAQRQFMIQKTASTADAVGAVHAMIEASNQLNDEIVDWLANELAIQ